MTSAAHEETSLASAYRDKVSREKKVFKENVQVHDLPDIYHYYADKHHSPKFREMGLGFYDVFLTPIRRRAEQHDGVVKVASLGAGNCDFEVLLLQKLRDLGLSRVEMHCYELNREMLFRGQEHAEKAGLADRVQFFEGDVNRDNIDDTYDVFLANQSLHHFVGLEHVFEMIKARLAPGGYFVTSDMIGRNGHMYWPEAYQVITDLWRLLPKEHTYNHQLKRFENPYENWDCSKEGFEGIRAQDILPLLTQHFHFEFFHAFTCVMDVFTGRAFGHNFDRNRPFDRAFIDLAAELDERLLAEGRLKPTHILAWMTVDKPEKLLSFAGQTPEKCIRPVDP